MKYFYGIIRKPLSEMPLGVRAVWIENGKTMSFELRDITNKVKELSNFVEILNRYSVDICHLKELTEDFLAKIYSPEGTFPANKNQIMISERYTYQNFECFCKYPISREHSYPAITEFSPLENG